MSGLRGPRGPAPVGVGPPLPGLRGPPEERARRDRGPNPVYEVEVAGRPETRRRVELPWDEGERRRLRAWLLWSSAVTVSLVLALYALARFLP